MVLVLGHEQLDAEATSLLAIIPVSLVGAWRQHRYGNLDHRAGLVIGAAAIPFAVIGVVAVNEVPPRLVEIAFALLLVYVAWQMARGALAELRKGREPGDGAAGTR
jgi:uncharacterized membrane protein YfcA